MKLRLALVVMSITSCNSPPETKVAAAPLLSPQQCQEASKALDDLGKQVPVEFAADGSLTLPRDAWLRMMSEGQSALVTAMAYRAACRSQNPSAEQLVTIRSEYGEPLVSNRAVQLPTAPSMVPQDN